MLAAAVRLYSTLRGSNLRSIEIDAEELEPLGDISSLSDYEGQGATFKILLTQYNLLFTSSFVYRLCLIAIAKSF